MLAGQRNEVVVYGRVVINDHGGYRRIHKIVTGKVKLEKPTGFHGLPDGFHGLFGAASQKLDV